MTPEIVPFVAESEAESAPTFEYDPTFERIRLNVLATHSLSSHMRKLRGRNHGFPRWIALAVFTGAVAALAFVNFLAH